MRSSFVRGASLLALICGFYAADSHAQTDGAPGPDPFQECAGTGAGPDAATPLSRGVSTPSAVRVFSPRSHGRGPHSGDTRSDHPAPTTPAPSGPLTEPLSPGGSGGTANATDVALPRAERAGGGGEPTEAEAAEEAAPDEEAEGRRDPSS